MTSTLNETPDVLQRPDVMVVGGGPGGAASAYWLARSGHSVVVAEKKSYPRDKTCGDGLTPRAIKQLADMGFDFDIPELHFITGLRAYAGNTMLEIPWPEHTIYPNWGAVIRRSDLDLQVAMLAEKQGAMIVQRTTASAVVEDGRLIGVDLDTGGDVTRVHPKYVVVADGSLSRFGRSLGSERDKSYPYGLAVRGYFASPFSKDSFLESHLDMRDEQGRSVPGYGWLFPLGDGQVNVGVGALSTFKNWKDVNTSDLMRTLVRSLPSYWEITEESQLTEPRGGKLPMSFSVGPKTGANWVLVGDAAGAINPFNGEGIDYGYETGRLAATYVSDAIKRDDRTLLAGYGEALQAEYALYNRVARAFVVAIGRPAVMRTLVRTGLRSRPLMEWVLKVMANLLEPEDLGVAERAYRMVERIVQLGPEPT